MFSIFGNFSMFYECLTYSPFETRPGYYRNSPLIAYWIELRQCNEEIASFAKKTSSSSHAAGQESCYIHRLSSSTIASHHRQFKHSVQKLNVYLTSTRHKIRFSIEHLFTRHGKGAIASWTTIHTPHQETVHGRNLVRFDNNNKHPSRVSLLPAPLRDLRRPRHRAHSPNHPPPQILDPRHAFLDMAPRPQRLKL